MPTPQVLRKEVEEMQQKKPPRMINRLIKLSSPLNVDGHKNKKLSHSHNVSTLSPTYEATTRKSSSGRWDCLCSPTTHAGSFRCRHHRAEGMRRVGSIDSNLSSLGSKDSVH